MSSSTTSSLRAYRGMGSSSSSTAGIKGSTASDTTAFKPSLSLCPPLPSKQQQTSCSTGVVEQSFSNLPGNAAKNQFSSLAVLIVSLLQIFLPGKDVAAIVPLGFSSHMPASRQCIPCQASALTRPKQGTTGGSRLLLWAALLLCTEGWSSCLLGHRKHWLSQSRIQQS